jgi:hypothetical protein
MSRCEQFGRQLPQYIADGEPELAIYSGLRDHLATCPACRTYASNLRVVEEALRNYPSVSPAPAMAGLILQATSQARQADQEEWHLLTWDVWVPALAFALALLIAIVSFPSQHGTITSLRELAGTIVAWPGPIGNWLAAIQEMTKESLFWVIWVGIFAVAAGIGICLSLMHWNRENSKSLDRIETRIADAAARFWDHGRRTS